MFNLISFIKKNISLLLLAVFIGIFITPLFKGLLPIPTDTIVGLYHPYRDLYAKNYPNGVPFKNFLITDPVRQTYPWKNLAIDIFSKHQLPIWNPYEMAGKPLLGNFQTGAFYPLNIILFVKPFYLSWSIFIVSQLILGAGFMYMFLGRQKIDKKASLFGALTLTFSGFFVAWLEWGNILSTAIWLPLILYAIDKSIITKNSKWVILATAGLVFSFSAGHLQTFFYLSILSFAYFIFKIAGSRNGRIFYSYMLAVFAFLVITSVQWIVTLKYILLSARNYDQLSNSDGWFLPIHHLVQFIAPDFFGNPTTLNYFGEWNYAEMVGYVGIVALVFSIYSLFLKNKTVWFFSAACFLSLFLAIKNPISELPFTLGAPFISTAQPTRLLFISCFSLSVLSAIGLNEFIQKKDKKVFVSLAVITFILISLWIVVLFFGSLISNEQVNLLVVRRNLVVPSLITVSLAVLLFISFFSKKYRSYLVFVIVLISAIDLLRFANKFEPFGKKEYLYPTTKSIDFLKGRKEVFRIASNDSRILPPNFSTVYKLESIEGYDPLYLLSYAQYIAALERKDADIKPPFGFNRIITPHNINSNLIDLLNVKYVLSLSEIKSPKFKEVLKEGQTTIYENQNVIERAFFVNRTEKVQGEQEEAQRMVEADLSRIAFGIDLQSKEYSKGKVKIISHQENTIEIETDNINEGFLVLSDVFYPTWKAKIDGKKTRIYKTDLIFRGVVVPKGRHKIEFYITLF